MPENDTAAAPRASLPTSRIVLGLVLIAAVGGVIFWLTSGPPDRSGNPVLTPEAKAYVRYLGLGDVEMKATESYLKQAVVEISGTITNKGDRTLTLVEINCVFYDSMNQIVLRERLPIAGGKFGSLAPGEIRPFRLPFDNIPDSWNQAMPQLVIAQIRFE